MKINFEAAIEKLARIMSRNYNVNIIFRKGVPCTDGKNIYLPFFTEMTQDFYNDLNGFLDHEVAHCKFTDFNALKKIERIKSLSAFAESIEDERIEEEMKLEYPGVSLHLDPLNDKINEVIKDPKNWKKFPASVRFAIGIRAIMARKEPTMDKDIAHLLLRCWSKAERLSDCSSTQEVIDKVKEIMELASMDMTEEEIEEKEKEDGDCSDCEDGMDSDGESDGEESESDSSKRSKSTSGGSGKKSKKSKHTTEEGEDSETDGVSAKDKAGKGLDFKESDMAKMPDIHKHMEEKISEFEDSKKSSYSEEIDQMDGYEWEKSISKPVTTEFDTVTEYSGKGSESEYRKLKQSIQKYIAPMKISLEKILKVKENAKWKVEQEQGKLNSKSLSKLITTPGTRTVFKTFSKHDTKNVAIQMLIDLSGSMGGGDKIQLAKECATVLAESLTDLNINFEITGFNSISDAKVSKVSGGRYSDDGGFSRTHERLDLYVFKSFETTKLNGITKIKSLYENPDGECVAWAAKRLSLRKEKRKILFVLSDGLPSTGDTDHGILNNDLKVKVQRIEASGIECVGIGIASNGVKQFYKNYVVVNNLRTLTEVFTKKIKEILLK